MRSSWTARASDYAARRIDVLSRCVATRPGDRIQGLCVRSGAMTMRSQARAYGKRARAIAAATRFASGRRSCSPVRSRFARRHAMIPRAKWDALKQRAASERLTPSNVLLTAYAEVVATWASADDFTLNLTIGNRPQAPEFAGILGVFTALTPFAVHDVRGGAFATRAQTQQAQLVRDLDHRAFSGVEVQRLIAQRAGDPVAGILPVVFTSMVGESDAPLPGVEGVAFAITETPQTWLDNKVYEEDGGLGIDWDAPEALFPSGMLDAMFEAYIGLIESLADGDAAWIAPKRSLVPAGQCPIFHSANATDAPAPGDLLHARVLAPAVETPGAQAVIAPQGTLSFEELDRCVRTLAHALHAALKPSDVLVAIVMEKGVEQVIAALAILECGRAFLPISAGQPDLRIQTILDQAGVRVVLTQPRIRRGRQWRTDVTLIDVPAEVPDITLPRLPQCASPDDLAYVIYTSGSTGIPKGVVVSHRAAQNTLADIACRFAVDANDRVLWVSSFEFDLSIFDIFGVLSAGGTLVIPEPDGHRNPALWAECVARHGVTIWNSVPAIAELLLSGASGMDGAPLDSLRLFLLSGDWIPVSLPGRLRESVPDADIVSLGGATEAAIWSIYYRIETIDPAGVSVPYGTPLRNQRFHVLKRDLQPCPIYSVGKLYIAGLGLAEGYWNNPEQTKARFITHPETGERLYDTGDLGRYGPDGVIEFLGREDQQIKLRGFRIELGEIEAALAKNPGVQTAIAMLDLAGATKRIVAFVIGTEKVPDRLRQWAEEWLPDYMIPQRFVPLDALPLTPNGKLDRKALAALCAQPGENERALNRRGKDHLRRDTRPSWSFAGQRHR